MIQRRLVTKIESDSVVGQISSNWGQRGKEISQSEGPHENDMEDECMISAKNLKKCLILCESTGHMFEKLRLESFPRASHAEICKFEFTLESD